MLHKSVTVLLLFIVFIHMEKYVNCSICAFTVHITTNVQTLCWSKTSPSFSGAHTCSSCISRSINTKFVPQIDMYIRINMAKTDFIYLNIWCDSKYITIKQLNEWVKQFTLSVYASKYSAKFLSKNIFLFHTFNIYFMHIGPIQLPH